MFRSIAASTLLLGICISLIVGCSMTTLSLGGSGRIVPSFDGYPLWAYRLTSGDVKKDRPDPKAILFYIQGSEYATVLNENTMGMLASAAALGSEVIVVDRRGVQRDTVLVDTCRAYADKETRVRDHLAVIHAVLDESAPNVPIVLMGSSEGGDVAAEIAEREERITHLVLLGSGGGWSQEEEFRNFIRTSPPYLGLQTEREFDSVVAEIKKRPNSMEIWAGHPFKRWSSYMFDPPIESLKNLSIPIFLAHGGEDASVPVESARALANTFDRLGKRNLTYREYADADHRFMSAAREVSLYPLLEVDIVEWLVRQGLLTREEAHAFTSRVRKAHREIFEE